MRVGTLILAAASTLALATANASAVTYSYHNGYGPTDHVDINDNVPADLWWANDFTTQPGGNLITDVHLAFGGGWTLGTPVSVLIYRDLDNDGNPDNLQLAMRLDSTITVTHVTNDPATVQSFDVPDTVVSGHFFVGALVLNAPALASIRSEITDPQHRSFLAVNETAGLLGTFDPAHPELAETPPTNIDTLAGQGVDFYVEAIGAQAVPEPSLAIGMVAVGLTLARRTRRS